MNLTAKSRLLNNTCRFDQGTEKPATSAQKENVLQNCIAARTARPSLWTGNPKQRKLMNVCPTKVFSFSVEMESVLVLRKTVLPTSSDDQVY